MSPSRAVRVPAGDVFLEADLALPRDAAGLVVFAHGSGSSRHSPRNRGVAGALNEEGLGTLLVDLLTAEEGAIDERTSGFRFDIPLIAKRLTHLTDTLRRDDRLGGLPTGYFGASTGGAAALSAAAARPDEVAAIVVRGGRPDLASGALGRVRAPTLLIVGDLDREVLELNRSAAAKMRAATRIAIVVGATHLFPEPGALEEVARLAADWFLRHMSTDTDSRRVTAER